MLVAVVNAGPADTDAAVRLDLAKLGIPGDAKACDADTVEELPRTAEGLGVRVKRHDYRQLLVTAGAVKKTLDAGAAR